MDTDWEILKRKIAAVLAQDIGELDTYQEGYAEALVWVKLTMAQLEKAHAE